MVGVPGKCGQYCSTTPPSASSPPTPLSAHSFITRLMAALMTFLVMSTVIRYDPLYNSWRKPMSASKQLHSARRRLLECKRTISTQMCIQNYPCALGLTTPAGQFQHKTVSSTPWSYRSSTEQHRKLFVRRHFEVTPNDNKKSRSFILKYNSTLLRYSLVSSN